MELDVYAIGTIMSGLNPWMMWKSIFFFIYRFDNRYTEKVNHDEHGNESMNSREDDYNVTQNEVDELNVLQDLLKDLHMGQIMGWRE